MLAVSVSWYTFLVFFGYVEIQWIQIITIIRGPIVVVVCSLILINWYRLQRSNAYVANLEGCGLTYYSLLNYFIQHSAPRDRKAAGVNKFAYVAREEQ